MARQSRQPGRTRRSGGRSARHAARAERSATAAVQPGQSGGQFRPLSDSDIERIHDAALDVLENIGIGDPIAEVLNDALPGGCILGEDNRLCLPRALVEDLIDLKPEDMQPGNGRW